MDKLIVLLEEAIQPTPDGDPPRSLTSVRCPSCVFNNQTTYRTSTRRFRRLRGGCNGTSEGQLDRLEMLRSLWGACFARASAKLGEVENLDKSIWMMGDALLGHAARSKGLTSLGISWAMRSQHRQRQGKYRRRVCREGAYAWRLELRSF